MDDWLEYAYEDQYYWDDAEEFELNQLALDREYDFGYDGDEDEEPYGYDSQDEFESAGQPPF